MAQVKLLPPCKLSLGMKSLINFINSHDKAKIIEISKNVVPFKIDDKWNFDVTIDSLTKNY